MSYWGKRARGVWFSSIIAAYVPGNLKTVGLHLFITRRYLYIDIRLHGMVQWADVDRKGNKFFWLKMIGVKVENILFSFDRGTMASWKHCLFP